MGIGTVLEKETADLRLLSKLLPQYLEELPRQMINFGIKLVLAVVALLIGMRLIGMIRKIVKKSLQKGNADTGVIQFLDSFVKMALYAVLLLFIAGNFGLEATSVLAILGSAGVAIGLAMQGSLSNVAGGVLILLLKPFKVGDYIIENTNQNEGTVTEIELFYTKLHTMDDKVIVLPNGALANTSLVNITATDKRRLSLKIGISYSSDIRLAKQIAMQLLEQDAAILQEEAKIVCVDDLADSAVVIGIHCWFRNEDYWEGKWRLLEEIKHAYDDANIVIPFPQMEVTIKN